ncbi:hypothetical protein BJ878DRAFT_515635 [Calycina marina]|uniref:Uncharacterized protein n=1 Tax=Calycina marina TaxID=1763456 RepID=A0A9P7Z056_9HELO|nr:hypothetical protein BJ878DRAFT_515635 [Calycina marina]
MNLQPLSPPHHQRDRPYKHKPTPGMPHIKRQYQKSASRVKQTTEESVENEYEDHIFDGTPEREIVRCADGDGVDVDSVRFALGALRSHIRGEESGEESEDILAHFASEDENMVGKILLQKRSVEEEEIEVENAEVYGNGDEDVLVGVRPEDDCVGAARTRGVLKEKIVEEGGFEDVDLDMDFDTAIARKHEQKNEKIGYRHIDIDDLLSDDYAARLQCADEMQYQPQPQGQGQEFEIYEDSRDALALTDISFKYDTGPQDSVDDDENIHASCSFPHDCSVPPENEGTYTHETTFENASVDKWLGDVDTTSSSKHTRPPSRREKRVKESRSQDAEAAILAELRAMADEVTRLEQQIGVALSTQRVSSATQSRGSSAAQSRSSSAYFEGIRRMPSIVEEDTGGGYIDDEEESVAGSTGTVLHRYDGRCGGDNDRDLREEVWFYYEKLREVALGTEVEGLPMEVVRVLALIRAEEGGLVESGDGECFAGF